MDRNQLKTIIVILIYCSIPQVKMLKEGLSPSDPSSYSRPDLATVTDLFINLSVNFDKKILSGSVDLNVKKIDENAKEIILDVKDLNISKILAKDSSQELKYVVSDHLENFGSKLTVELPDKPNQIISIFYETSPTASGLQWLSPNQTSGKQYPFLFSQFQPIHARSVLPCQDTPAVKTTYKATISVPGHLTALMSAIPQNISKLHDATLVNFAQNVPVPSYLIAIAVGELESRKLGPRTHVWAEKAIIEDAAYEFAGTENQLSVAEEICGPYVWGIYDLLVLPPSFPFGGMENPCLTFATPTLLAGDRSLVDVVAHEIGHSWTGNLVTNRNFEHFWLNEGFTVFVERKILGRLLSPQDQDFSAFTEIGALRDGVNLLGADNPLTKLVVDLKGVHPDDAFSIVPYEKGQTFLRYLENVIGGPKEFEPFLRKYFDAFKYKSIDTDDFKNFFLDHFAGNDAINSIDWNGWLYTPGMPLVIPDYDTTKAQVVNDLQKKIIESDFNAEDFKLLTSLQVIYLLDELRQLDPLPLDKLEKLEQVHSFSKIKNAEIRFRWLRLGLKAHWDKVVEPTLLWLKEVGRMKYVRPLYRDLYAWEDVRSRAIATFKETESSMMHVVAYTLAKDLKLRE